MYQAAFRVLEVLEKSDGPVSGEAISNTLGISRSAVWKHIKELIDMGYEITASHREGYRLKKSSNRLLPYEVHKKLRTSFTGKKMRYFESTTSTNWVARQMAEEQDPASLHGMVIIAEQQTGGIGRLGRSWVSPRGGIWATVVVKPKIPIERVFMITMAGAIAIARALRKEYDLGALIKWPNDIYIGDSKVAGLLLEISAEADQIHYAVLGLGVDANVSPTDLSGLPKAVTSVSIEVGHDVDRPALLARILKEFESRYLLLEAGEYESIVREWKSLSCTLEHRVRVNTLKTCVEGEAIDIDEYGALLIRKDNGKVERVIAGDCTQQ
ncbi:MAG: putative biotin ligase [Methanoregulaceae archaeon PtaB.Bin056]|jgi:BirA family biotin operon repressor/biotin-[acetyl-CoA-carboxylase] ligase|nr:MAG: putative biotin ligase [Methanoregulaceae archaeon PtaB.Bin056]